MINEARENSDELAYKIYMPKEIQIYIEQMKRFMNTTFAIIGT